MSSPTAEKRPFRKRRLVYIAIALLALTGLGTSYGCEQARPTVMFHVGFGGPVVSVAFSADSRLLCVGTGRFPQGRVCVIDTSGGCHLARALLPTPVRCLAICPDTSGVWVGCGHIWDEVDDGRRPTGRVLGTGGAIVLLDLKTLKERTRLVEYDALNGLAVSPDGKTLAALTCNGGSAEKVDLKFWDVETGNRSKPITLDGHSYSRCDLRRTLAFSPDGKLLAIALGKAIGAPAEVVVWDAQKNEKAWSVAVSDGPPTWVSFSPDGAQLAIACLSLTIAEVKSAGSKRRVVGSAIGAVEWVPGQSQFAVATETSLVVERALLFDARQDETVFRFESPHRSATRSLAVSSDGKLLSAGDDSGYVYIWRIPKPWRLW